jgi:hypothetical protein
MRRWALTMVCAGLVGCLGPTGPQCSLAVERVQSYRAPGQAQALTVTVMERLASEPHPRHPLGWALGGPAGERCRVEFHWMQGDERRTATWWYTPTTGQVEPDDAPARRLSGG